MAKKKNRTRNSDVKSLAANDNTATKETTAIAPRLTPEQIIENAEKVVAPAPTSLRQASIQRSVRGKVNKVILNQIDGKECPKFYPWTWAQRDAAMEKPENAAVKERYLAHLALSNPVSKHDVLIMGPGRYEPLPKAVSLQLATTPRS